MTYAALGSVATPVVTLRFYAPGRI
jgi:hypothetical protein